MRYHRRPAWIVCALGIGILSAAAHAMTVENSSDPKDLDEAIKQLIRNPQPYQMGKSAVGVDPRKAKLCEICLKPLYLHGDPGFDGCYPPGKHVLEVKTRLAVCPVCKAQFKGALRGNLNDEGGRDRDFCAHSVGKYCVHSSVWMCPECGYAALIDSFGLDVSGKPLDAAMQSFVRETLFESTRKRMIRVAGLNDPIPPEMLKFSEYLPQTEIPDWQKYDNAIRIYARMNSPHTLMAALCLEGAHACRREVNAEVVAPGLHTKIQESLGASIRCANRLIQQETLNIHRQRGELAVDWSKDETDSRILAEAVQTVIRRAENAPPPDPNASARVREAALRTGDMFVLYLRLAGAFDRIGLFSDADNALQKALKAIPETVALGDATEEARTASEFLKGQIKSVRGVAESRRECLKLEREYLFNAAKSNMSALKFKEIKLRDPARMDAVQEKGVYDPALTAYLLGELLRRAEAFPEAALWLETACVFLDKELAVLGQAPKSLSKEDAENLRDRCLSLKASAQAQRTLFEPKGEPQVSVRALVETVLKDGGFPGLEVLKTPVPPSAPAAPGPVPAAPDRAAVAAASGAGAAVPAGGITTREQLFKMYYAALLRYRADKKKNPATLAELVQAGYVSAAESRLNENNKLICPETKEVIGYLRQWDPSKKTDPDPVLFPTKFLDSARLFANGDIRTGTVSRQ